MKGRPLTLAAASFSVVLVLTVFWWHTDTRRIHLPSPSLFSGATADVSNSAKTFEIREKVAVIVETRPLLTLIPLILHFSSVLGPDWPILLLTYPSTVRTLEEFGHISRPFKRMHENGQIQIRTLPTKGELSTYLGVSDFLASKWFWDQMGPADHMLLFQTDSMICANSGRKVEDFFEYDFVGAAHPFVAGAFNGGLALRNVSLSREVISRWNIADDVNEGSHYGLFEDVWFWDKMKQLGGRFPSVDVASEFSVDYIWAEKPLGYHGIGKGTPKERAEEVYKWCPEAVLAATWEPVALGAFEKNTAVIEGDTQNPETAGGDVLLFGYVM